MIQPGHQSAYVKVIWQCGICPVNESMVWSMALHLVGAKPQLIYHQMEEKEWISVKLYST